jgi:hypothetical protein
MSRGLQSASVFGRAKRPTGVTTTRRLFQDSKVRRDNGIRQADGGGGSGGGNTGKVIGSRPGISMTGGPGASLLKVLTVGVACLS